MSLSMNNSNYMSNRNHFQDIGTAQSRDQNNLKTSKIVKCSTHNFIEFSGPNQNSLYSKMAEIWPIL